MNEGGYTVFNPTEGSNTYNAIKNLLGTEEGKKTQKQTAYNDTAKVINELIEMGCTNQAILIYLADMFNQYGSGFPETKQKAVRVCSDTSKDLIQQLDVVIAHLKANVSTFNDYRTRRNATYSYVKELYNMGQFDKKDLTNEGKDANKQSNESYTGGSGQYCMPVRGHILISAGYGNSKNSGGQGYTNLPHNGMDFATNTGEPIYACTSGYVTYKTTASGFGKHAILKADDGNLLVFGHMSGFNGDNRTVSKGQVIGYVGSTGNSSGPHVHLGITSADIGESGLWNANWHLGKNPAPFLGIENKRDVYIDV